MLFFSKLGYLRDDETPLVAAAIPNRFVYSLLPADKLLGDRDRIALGATKTCAKIATFRSNDYEIPSIDIDVYAVDLVDCNGTRSEDAYGMHELFSKFNSHPSIVFFRCADAIMLSFLQFTGEGKLSIRLSDWLTANTMDEGQIDRMHVASCSLASAYDLFDSMEYESIRSYYKYPITRYIAAYDVVFPSTNLTLLIDFSDFSRDDQDKAIQKVLDTYPDMYGDDYIDDEAVEIDQDEELDLDNLEWEAQKVNPADNLESCPDDFEDEEQDVEVPLYQMPPAEVMGDPLALLEWMDRHSGEPSKESHPEGAYLDDSRELHSVPIGNSPPAAGSHIRHIRLGEGIVKGVQGRSDEGDSVYISALFGNTSRTFLFPGAFESGLVQLLA